MIADIEGSGIFFIHTRHHGTGMAGPAPHQFYAPGQHFMQNISCAVMSISYYRLMSGFQDGLTGGGCFPIHLKTGFLIVTSVHQGLTPVGHIGDSLYIGYHSPAGTDGSPLAHTINKAKFNWIKINGKIASEFTLNSMYAAQMGVPSLFLSGDQTICRLASEEIPQITTVAVKECRGNSTFNLHPADACDLIKSEVAKALAQPAPIRTLPEELVLEACLTSHQAVRSALAHPSISQIDESTIRYTAHSPKEVNTIIDYLL